MQKWCGCKENWSNGILNGSSESKEIDRTHTHFSWLPHCKFKTFGLLQPCFGHLSCMPVVCVTHYKLQRNASYLNQSLSVVEKLLPR